jgi:hypothetical protein
MARCLLNARLRNCICGYQPVLPCIAVRVTSNSDEITKQKEVTAHNSVLSVLVKPHRAIDRC